MSADKNEVSQNPPRKEENGRKFPAESKYYLTFSDVKIEYELEIKILEHKSTRREKKRETKNEVRKEKE